MHRKTKGFALAIGVLSVGFSTCAFAQFGGNGAYGTASNPNMTMGNPNQDYDFVEKSMNIVSAEMEWSKIAQAKTGNENVKTLANQTVTEDTPVAQRLVTEAKGDKIKVPDSLSGKYKKESDKLNSLSGDAFDKEYVSALMKVQHEDVGQMRDEAKSSKNPSLVEFATKTGDQTTARNDAAKVLDKQLSSK
jgi:predicted outer membrane protein